MNEPSYPISPQQRIDQAAAKEAEYNIFNNLMYNKEYQDFLKWQFDPDPLVKSLWFRFLGYCKDEDTGKWYQPSMKVQYKNEAGELIIAEVPDVRFRIMNIWGANSFIGLFESHIGKYYQMSNLQTEDIDQILLTFIHAIEEELVMHEDDYEISPSKFTYIRTILENQAFTALKSGLEGFRTRQLVSSYRSSEVINKPAEVQRSGLLGIGRFGL